MCDPKFRIGYEPCVRENAIDLLLAGNSRSFVARTMNVTWPTICKWLAEYRLAEFEISQHLNLKSP